MIHHTSSLMMHSLIFDWEGISYITSNMMFSMMARRPRAPDFLLIASLAMAPIAPSVKRSFTFSRSNSF